MRFGETFLWRALSSLETLAFSFMVDEQDNRRRPQGNNKICRRRRGQNGLFRIHRSLNLPLQKNRDPFLSLSERATREREREVNTFWTVQIM